MTLHSDRSARRLIATAAATLLCLALVAPPAAAAPNCIAQIGAEERQLYGPTWGHDVVSTLARNPELFEGATNFGQLVTFLSHGDPAACPEE